MALLTLSLSFSLSWADEKSLEGIEFLTGYSHANTNVNPDTKVNLNTVPFLVSFDFDLKSSIRKLGFSPSGLAQFQLEPYISYIFQPEHNLEMGNSFAFKLGLFPETCKLQPYAKIGLGILYTTLHTRAQSTQFDFNEYIGAGWHYFFNKKSAFTLEGRFRHVSNAGIKRPNRGINSYFVLSGIACPF